MEKMIQVSHVSYAYQREDNGSAVPALNDVSFNVYKGEFVAIIGHNGSGKSTLAKMLNAIYLPSQGDIVIHGFNTRDESHIWDIRQNAGIIFQNPDNQMVSTIVEEDIAFGPENLGVPPEEIRVRVDNALETVHMSAYRDKKIHQLSGGQKQRVAIAGMLAMEPSCLICDEITAMLDPSGREQVLRTVKKLNKDKGVSIVYITHYMDEIVNADRIIVMEKGQVVMEGTPLEIFSHVEDLQALSLDVPEACLLAYRLRQDGINLPEGIMTMEDLVQALCQLKQST